MRKLVTFLLLCLNFVFVNSQNQTFSDSTIVSLITCSPGQMAYEKFGHTAIRLNDSAQHIDVVFNYGIFSFETNNFYYKFIKGETDYQLGVYPTNYFLQEYKERNSTVWESVLQLNINEKRKLIQLLVENYQPENRFYRYNFIYDNCATRPRDKIINAINGHLNLEHNVEVKTYRQWIALYAGSYSWLNFGLDLVFGMDADENCPQYESMFLPEVLMNEIEDAKIITANSTESRNISAKPSAIVSAEPATTIVPWYENVLIIFLILLLAGIFFSVYEYHKNKHIKLIDTVLFAFTGIAGCIILFLMTASVHPLVDKNLNILWLNPFNLFAAIFIWNKKLKKVMFYYQIVNIVLLGLTLIAFALSFQTFNVATFPLIVLLLVRYTTGVAQLKHRIYPKNKYTYQKL